MENTMFAISAAGNGRNGAHGANTFLKHTVLWHALAWLSLIWTLAGESTFTTMVFPGLSW